MIFGITLLVPLKFLWGRKKIMNKGVFSRVGFGFLLAVSSWYALAADHRDAPGVRNDPAADINDIYAFMNPNDSNELILVNTVFPVAPSADPPAQFSDAVEYNFHIENNAEPSQNFLIRCTFSLDQTVTCLGPGDRSVVGPSGQINQNGDFRVFAGLRDDPFFLDSPALNETLATGVPSFRDPGVNTPFGGQNTLAIVVGIGRGAVSDNLTAPVIKVYGSTVRRTD